MRVSVEQGIVLPPAAGRRVEVKKIDERQLVPATKASGLIDWLLLFLWKHRWLDLFLVAGGAAIMFRWSGLAASLCEVAMSCATICAARKWGKPRVLKAMRQKRAESFRTELERLRDRIQPRRSNEFGKLLQVTERLEEVLGENDFLKIMDGLLPWIRRYVELACHLESIEAHWGQFNVTAIEQRIVEIKADLDIVSDAVKRTMLKQIPALETSLRYREGACHQILAITAELDLMDLQIRLVEDASYGLITDNPDALPLEAIAGLVASMTSSDQMEALSPLEQKKQ